MVGAFGFRSASKHISICSLVHFPPQDFGERVLIKNARPANYREHRRKLVLSEIRDLQSPHSNRIQYFGLWKFDILDTTQYMKNTLGVWKALDFQFDAISTGFIVSKEQTQMITDFCSENADKFKGLPLETCLEVLDE